MSLGRRIQRAVARVAKRPGLRRVGPRQWEECALYRFTSDAPPAVAGNVLPWPSLPWATTPLNKR